MPSLPFHLKHLETQTKAQLLAYIARHLLPSPSPPHKPRLQDSQLFRSKRKIALKVSYNGSSYSGFATQPTVESTIEGRLFEALRGCHLIPQEDDMRSLGYSRSARTDAGVSSCGSVISLYVRSRLQPRDDLGVIPWSMSRLAHQDAVKARVEDVKDTFSDADLPYGPMLNHHLPPDIRITHWAPVSPFFNARYACTSRTYEYFFDARGMDVPRMQYACQVFLGKHDFRNFCKRESHKPEASYKRTVTECTISPMYPGLSDRSMEEISWSVLRVSAPSFLWHQIRYMASALFQVGLGDLSVQGIKEMLSEGHTAKKRWLARPEGLLLTECSYSSEEPRWQSVQGTTGRRQSSLLCCALSRVYSST